MKPGEGKAAQAREALQDAAPLAVRTIIDLAQSTTDPRSLAAAIAILNRIGLHEKSGVEVTGADGGPMRIERVIIDAANPDATGLCAPVASEPL